ncbi:hypothetical protein IV203_032439 [Nitzschia inconspicua]|uniref:Uncharacterized protein n=1 Tax=Nitzschia inconspicua TaxID=303405 RepID=A0A9K3PEZ1_9STRA|nr:hypothetical protein IV203_032439 [Nitzschia inconspicua]
MTSTKKIHRKLHNDKKRKKPEERDRVRMLKNDSKGHPSVARFFFVYQNRQIRCAHLLTTTQAIVNIIQLLKFFQFTKLRLMPENSVFDSDDAHQFTDNAMEDGRDIFPKLPVQLKKYHRYWERNRRIQDAIDRAKSDIELLNSYLTKSVPLELEDGCNVDDTAGDAIAELDGEVGLGGRETGNGLGREHQHVEVRPPAQQRNVVGNSNMVSLSLQELMLRNQMAIFASYMRRNLQAPNFPAAMPLPLLVNRKRPADALPITVAGETIAAMAGFIPDLHREKRRTRGGRKIRTMEIAPGNPGTVTPARLST